MKSIPTIGVVSISYNEEVDLPGFLENLVKWVDEIVIIDDGSSDNSEKICLSYGPKVKFIKSKRKPNEFFSHQRNKGIDISTTDWILHLDIDERVSKEMSSEILSSISSKKYDAYKFKRLNYFFHRPMKGGGWADWNLVHLAKRKVLRFEGMFHEKIILKTNNNKIGQLKNKMHHFNDDSYSERLKKSLVFQDEVIKSYQKRKLIVRPLTMIFSLIKEFLVKYFYKKGFLDGMPGLISALHSTFAIFRAHAVLWENQNKIQRKSLEKSLRDNWKR